MLRVFYGAGDLSRIEIRGPYKVGFKSYFVKKTSCAVSVFYPMDKSWPAPASEMKLFPYGMEGVTALTRADAYVKGMAFAWPARLFGLFATQIVLPVCSAGPLAEDFLDGKKKLVPIVFSHGLTASRALYTTHCRELAACGYIVFSLDHHDGSCHYTEDAEENPIIFDTEPSERVVDGNFNEVYVKV